MKLSGFLKKNCRSFASCIILGSISAPLSSPVATRQLFSSTSSDLFVQTCGTSLGSETSCENLRRQLSSKDAAALPQPLMLGQTRCSQSHKLGAQKHSDSHATVPLIKRGAERKRRETQRHTARRLSAQMAVRTFYTRIDEQEQHRTTDRCSSPFPQNTVMH